MSAIGRKIRSYGGIVVLAGAVLSAGQAFANQDSTTPAPAPKTTTHHHKKAVKKAPLPILPSGPTGPVQQIPLDSIAAVPPQVSFQDNQLTIVAPNSTLADILRAVRKQTGAEIDIPAAPERVVTRLGPGPAREVLSDLLNGSRFNYVLLGAPGNEAMLTRIVLVQKTPTVAAPTAPAVAENQAGMPPANGQVADQEGQANDADAVSDDSATDDNSTPDQPAEATDQSQQAPDQTVKTPQQMLQEMQQRQLQMQQQQQAPGQPPGPGMPPHPPQEQ